MKEFNNIPSYMDGFFELYRLEEDESSDFPKNNLIDQNMKIFYRELNVYDQLRTDLSQEGKKVTLKIRIPQYRGIDSNCLCKIDGIFHEVYSSTHVVNKNGCKETELILVAGRWTDGNT